MGWYKVSKQGNKRIAFISMRQTKEEALEEILNEMGYLVEYEDE